MSNLILTNLFRFLGLVTLQVLVLKRIGIGWGDTQYVNVLLYPLFLILLPLRTPKPVVLLLGFLIGIAVDMFYDSPGIHASAAVFTGYVRNFILGLMEPRGKYNVNFSPTKQRMGLNWFFRYASFMMAVHLLFYFSVEAFTFVYIWDILLKTVGSYFLSMFFVLIYMFMFNPLD